MTAGRFQRLLRAARVERRELARLRPHVGTRRALAERARIELGLDGTNDAVTRLERSVQLLTDELVGTQENAARIDARLRHLEQVADRDAHRIGALETQIAVQRAAQLADADRQRDLWLAREILVTSTWVERLPPSSALVSVIMPTRNRPGLLREAIASVLRQTHQRFELLVVDDASDPETAAVLEEIDDPRIRWFRRERNGGGGAARNIGLAHARGEYIAYLDDDNLLGHLWLRGLIWGFEHHPGCDIVYGAMVHDYASALDGLPTFMLRPWDRQRQVLGNAIDQGMVAHRAGLPGAVYDEDVRDCGDWDFVVRLTADRDPVRVPIVAVHYRTRHAGRLSDNGHMRAESLVAQQRFARRGPLRVLVLDDPAAPAGGAPEMTAAELERQGDHVVRVAAEGARDGSVDLHAVIRTERPDVVLLGADPELEARLEEWFAAYAVLTPAGRGERAPHGTGPSTSLGRWDGRTPFGIADGGRPLRVALLRRLDAMHAEWLGISLPETLPDDERFPVVVTSEVPGLVTVVRDPGADAVD